MTSRRNQRRVRPADNLARSIAEQSLRPAIPARHYSIQVFTHDGIVRRVDDCGQALTRACTQLAARQNCPSERTDSLQCSERAVRAISRSKNLSHFSARTGNYDTCPWVPLPSNPNCLPDLE